LLARLTRGEEMPMDMAGRERPRAQRLLQAGSQDYVLNLNHWAGQFAGAPAVRHQQMQRLLLASAPHEPIPAGADDLAFIGVLLLDPVYQLK
jgi:hypothetical protein